MAEGSCRYICSATTWLPIKYEVAFQSSPARVMSGVCSERQKMKNPCGADFSASSMTSSQDARRAINSAKRVVASAGTAASYFVLNAS
jgi:hypothetical protein